MKLTFVTSYSLFRHATIKRAWGMAPELIASGVSVSIVCEECAENRTAVASIPGLTALYYPPKLKFLQERRYKEALIVQLKPEVVHICGLGWRNAVSTSGCFSIMDHVEMESAIPSFGPFRRQLQRFLEQWSFTRYSGTVVASRYLEFEVRRSLLKRSIRRPIQWLPFAFDQQQFRCVERDVLNWKEGSLGRKTIVYMGGLYVDYGVRDLVEAYRRLALVEKNCRLVFVGRGPEEGWIREACRIESDCAQIEFLGFIDEAKIASFLMAADVLVSPLGDTIQDWARCPSKTYMYMATRRPIVTSAVGENREALGDLGYYYRNGETGSLCDALQRAIRFEGPVGYDLCMHTWAARVKTYLTWLKAENVGVHDNP